MLKMAARLNVLQATTLALNTLGRLATNLTETVSNARIRESPRVSQSSPSKLLQKLRAVPFAIIIGSLLGSLVITGCSMVDRGEAIFSERGITKLDPDEETPNSYLPEVPRVTIEEVKAKLDTDSNIVVIDSRSKDDYERSRIVGAISIPLDDMAEPYSHLNRYDEIITYCT